MTLKHSLCQKFLIIVYILANVCAFAFSPSFAFWKFFMNFFPLFLAIWNVNGNAFASKFPTADVTHHRSHLWKLSCSVERWNTWNIRCQSRVEMKVARKWPLSALRNAAGSFRTWLATTFQYQVRLAKHSNFKHTRKSSQLNLLSKIFKLLWNLAILLFNLLQDDRFLVGLQ